MAKLEHLPRTNGGYQAEKRRHRRYQVDMPGTVWFRGRPMIGSFIDISANGALAVLPRLLPEEAKVVVGLPGFGRYLCEVVRTGRDGTGLRILSKQPSRSDRIHDAAEIPAVH